MKACPSTAIRWKRVDWCFISMSSFRPRTKSGRKRSPNWRQCSRHVPKLAFPWTPKKLSSSNSIRGNRNEHNDKTRTMKTIHVPRVDPPKSIAPPISSPFLSPLFHCSCECVT